MSKKTLWSGIFVLVIVITIGVFIANKALSPQSQIPREKKITIVTSFYPLYFLARQIGGDVTAVINLTPPGTEPHDYEPSAQDIAQLQNSQLIVVNGGVEAWANKLAGILKGSPTKIVVAGQGLLQRQLVEEGQTIADPHIWLDPLLAKQEAQTIEQALISLDPTNASVFSQNLEQLNAKLDQLDQEYRLGLSRCQGSDIVTSHAAFGYLSAQYHLNQVPIAGLSPDEEPSAQQLATVSDFVRSHKVHYIFFESLVSPKLSQTIATETGAQTLVLDPIEGLSPEALQRGQDYLTVMKANLKNLRTALQCS